PRPVASITDAGGENPPLPVSHLIFKCHMARCFTDQSGRNDDQGPAKLGVRAQPTRAVCNCVHGKGRTVAGAPDGRYTRPPGPHTQVCPYNDLQTALKSLL